MNCRKEAAESVSLHGSYEFPLRIFRIHPPEGKREDAEGWNWYEELRFYYVETGYIQFLLREKKYVLGAGSGIFVNQGCMHKILSWKKNGESACLCMDVHPRLLGSFEGSVLEKNYVAPFLKGFQVTNVPLHSSIEWQKRLLEKLPRLEKLCEEKAFGYEAEAFFITGKMWMELLKNRLLGYDESAELPENAVVNDIIVFLNRHYAERITLEMIAREVGVNKSECCRLFKEVTQDTIFSYLTLYRLSCASKLLIQSESSITEIAFSTGFNNTSYFGNLFRQRFGVTPGQYRSQHRK